MKLTPTLTSRALSLAALALGILTFAARSTDGSSTPQPSPKAGANEPSHRLADKSRSAPPSDPLGSRLAELQRACDQGNYNACFDLAATYVQGDQVPKNSKRAVPLLEKACSGGFALGCVGLGELYAEGNGVDLDPKRALSLFSDACKNGQAFGCYRQGKLLQDSGTSSADAVALFEKACEDRVAVACNAAADMYVWGWSVARDRVRGARLKRQACELGGDYACAEAQRLQEPNSRDSLEAVLLDGRYSVEEKINAAHLLSTKGAPAAPALAEIVKHPLYDYDLEGHSASPDEKARLQIEAAHSLEKMGPEALDAVQALEGATKSPNKNVREAALRALKAAKVPRGAERSSEAQIAKQVGRLRSDNRDELLAATEALGKLGSPAIDYLTTALSRATQEKDSPDFRSKLVLTIGMVNQEQTDPLPKATCDAIRKISVDESEPYQLRLDAKMVLLRCSP